MVRLVAGGTLPMLAVLSLLPASLTGQVPWEYRAPTEARRTASIAARDLTEASGLAASSAHPGVLWTIQDSGNRPDVFAIDTAGAVLGRWRVSGVRNVDWEAMSIGPCGPRSCIYVGDTGDNSERRGVVSVHRFAEPLPANARGGGRIEEVESLNFRYPDGAHDTEALVVRESGEILLVSKGRSGGIRAYRLPASAWGSGERVTAELIGILPLPLDGLTGLVTDAALHPDGATLVVRTYATLYFFDLGAEGRPDPAARPVACGILGLELQGEGVTWRDAETMALVSEAAYGMPGTVSIVRCPRD